VKSGVDIMVKDSHCRLKVTVAVWQKAARYIHCGLEGRLQRVCR
jgi:hypothetical protein